MFDQKRKRPRLLDAEGLWQFAIKVLASRACTIGELRQKLRSKAERPDDIAPTISRLKEYGYLDDAKFAETFATSRLVGKGLGKTRVLHDLRQRRVAPAVADHAVETTYRETNETELIESFIRRKYRTAPKENLFQNSKDLSSAYRRLLRAGFTPGNIVKVLKRFAEKPDLLDGFEPPDLLEE